MTQGQKSSSLNLTNETDDIHGTNEICRPQAKKAGRGVEEMTAKQKQITVGRRL